MQCAELVESYWARQRAIALIQAGALLGGEGGGGDRPTSDAERVSPLKLFEMAGVDLGSQIS